MRSLSKIGKSVFGGFLVMSAWAGPRGASPARAGEGDDPATSMAKAEAAQSRADAARARIDELEPQKGWVYKSGALARERAAAARYQAKADAERLAVFGLAPATPPVPADVAAAQERVDELKFQAGWAYKGNHVAAAQNDVRALQGLPAAGVRESTAEEQEEEAAAKKATPTDADKPVMKTQDEQP